MITRIGRFIIQTVEDNVGIVVSVSDDITGKVLETMTFRNEELPDVRYCPYCKNYYEVEEGHSCWEMRSGLADVEEK